MDDNKFLELHEIEVAWYPEGWNAYRFGRQVARGFTSKKKLINYLKDKYGFQKTKEYRYTNPPRRKPEIKKAIIVSDIDHDIFEVFVGISTPRLYRLLAKEMDTTEDEVADMLTFEHTKARVF